MIKTSIEQYELVKQWFGTQEFWQTLSTQEISCISDIYSKHEYHEQDASYLNAIRDDWITYLKKKNCKHPHAYFVPSVGHEYCGDCESWLYTCD